MNGKIFYNGTIAPEKNAFSLHSAGFWKIFAQKNAAFRGLLTAFECHKSLLLHQISKARKKQAKHSK